MEKNPDLEKLLKLKESIQKDVDKKHGKKTERSAEARQKITLSDDLRKRMGAVVSINAKINDFQTILDIERYLSDSEDIAVIEFFNRNLFKIDESYDRENLSAMILLLEKKFTAALEAFKDLLSIRETDYVIFNKIFAKMCLGENTDEDILIFLKNFRRSVYPYLAVLIRSIFSFKTFESFFSTLKVIGRTESDLSLLFSSLGSVNLSEINKSSLILYRKMVFKEFQNIIRLIPLSVSKNQTLLETSLEKITKKSSHHCSNIYYEYFSGEETCSKESLGTCPLGMFISGRRALVSKNKDEAILITETLSSKFNDPFSALLSGSLLYSEGKREDAYKAWYELIKPFEKVVFLWITDSPSIYVGLGIGKKKKNFTYEEYKIPSSFIEFAKDLELRLSKFKDFEIILYPYEEIRFLFGSRFCSILYK